MFTCAALSTAPGKAGIAVIRLSGEDAIAVASDVFVPADGRFLAEEPAAHLTYGSILYEGKKIDTGMCAIFRAPKSYTGEDMAEIDCHGSEAGCALILEALYAAGAQPAGPGEFTKRAFLNGKLSLAQAEAVAELIEAQNAEALLLSNAKVRGALDREVDEIASQTVALLASAYAAMDYPEEDLAEMPADEMRNKVVGLRDRLAGLVDSYDTGKAILEGIPAVIAGVPNTGKSTLFNLLTGYDRAIVTDVAGTTRDIVTEQVKIAGLTLKLSDTAGMHAADDLVERIGVERAYGALEQAELVFAVFDAAAPFSLEDENFYTRLQQLQGKKIIVVLNKADLGGRQECAALRQIRSHVDWPCVWISAKTGEGVEQLEQAVKSLYPYSQADLVSGKIITSARQFQCMKKALSAFDDALRALMDYTPDLAGMDLERVVEALRETSGRQVSQDIVDEIFSHFCVGK